MRALFSFFLQEPQELVSVSIGATGYVNFKQIDTRIVQICPWREQFTTRVQLPKDNADEIIAKLKAHHEITAVNGEPILHYAEAHDKTRTPNLPT